MPSTFSPALRLELIGNGEQAGNWGNTTNTNLGTLLEQAITGVGNITMADANYTLVSGNGVSDEARNAVLVVAGTLSATRNLVVPTSNKFYAVRNATTGSQSIVIKTSAGTGVTLANGFTQLMYCDGTNVVLASLPINSTTGSVGSLSIDGLVVSANSSTDAVRITQTGSGNALLVEDSANPDASPFIITAAGDAGIGTSTPVGKLQVAGGRALFGPNSEVYAIGVGFNQTRVAAGEVFFVGASNATAPDLIIANSSGLERVRVTNAGDVGIGTSPTSTMTLYNSTASILRVEGDAQAAVQVRRYSNDAQSPAQTFFKYRGTLASPAAVQTGDVAGALGWNVFGGTNVRQIGAITTGVESFVSDADISGALIFSVASAGTLTERLRIASAGQIGIGGTNYGTSGQVLTSNGASAAPSWQTQTATAFQLREQLFTASSTWTAPAGVTQARVTVIGAGGGGGGGVGGCCGADGRPGGSGGISVGVVSVTPSTSYTITIGIGGTGGAAGGSNGTSGGTSSFSSLMSATGGAGGGGGGGSPGASGSGSGGTLRNGSTPAVVASPFTGTTRVGGSGTAAIAWSASAASAAGNGGGGGVGSQAGAGGTNGIVYIEWVGI
jgi:hypothetical protein